jgi:hypothetical protein
MEPKHVTIGHMEAMLEQLSFRIEALMARKADHQRIDDLKVWRAKAQARLDGFRALESENWESIEPEIARAWSELENVLDGLRLRQKKPKR